MMDLNTFHREFCEDFIALYKSLPCLWNSRCKDYTDRQKKTKGYEQLVLLQRQVNPKACRESVMKKINSLRTTYRRERRKVENGRKKNEQYVPTLWYYDMMKFVDDGNEETQYEEGEMVVEEYLDDYRPLNTITEVKPEPVNTSVISECNIKKKIKVDDSFARRDTSQSDGERNCKEPAGRFVYFGKYIAQELDRLPEGMAVYCQKLINDTIFEAQMGTLSAKSRIVNNFRNLDQNSSSYDDDENNI